MKSRSPLSAELIVAALTEIVGADNVVTDPSRLAEASTDRFKKYQRVHGIFDGPKPCAIVFPADASEVSRVLRFADENLVNVVPRTGGTGTEGGLETAVDDSVVLDGSRMNRVLNVDPVNMMATAQCGVPLQVLEDQVRTYGLTTGHSPQSKPIAAMGGLVATRSIGQLSTLYGAIEDMVVGLEAVFPDGHIARIKNVPRRAAGPDIRHVVIGNEGALCVITEVTVKLFPFVPENNAYRGYLVDSMEDGLRVLHDVVTAGYRPSVCRVYSEEDARQHFAHFHDGRCVLVFVAEGPKGIVDATVEGIEAAVHGISHTVVAPTLIADWFAQLNWDSARIEAEKRYMLEHRRLGYTTEVSAAWSECADLYHAVMTRVRSEFPRADDLTMLGAHSSHSYQTGTNLYFVYDYDIRCEPREELHAYHVPLNAIIVEEALRHGGSMVHHHGVGKYRTPWVREEHGSAYFLLERLKNAFDPNGIMNAATIFPAEGFTDCDPAPIAGDA